MQTMTDTQEERDRAGSQLTRWELEIKREQVQRTLGMQEDLLRFLKWMFSIAFAVTLPTFIAAIFLDAWAVYGFETSDKVLITLGAVTGSEIVALISTSIKTFLKPPKI